MKKTIMTTLLLVSLLLIIGCGGAGINGRAPHAYDGVKVMVAEAKAGIEKIEIEAFNTKMESDDMFILLDIRERHEYDEGNIAGSVNISRGLLEFKIADEAFWDDEGMFAPEKDEEIIVYGQKIDRGAMAAETLVKLGYNKVKYLYGGWTVWEHGPDALEVEEEVVVEEGCGA
ncbi:hypothetical protein HQ585_06130 [candidate division KSB1 bacterium]|nr:hypothetical protein [candidate division KSB1 bacterium]